MVLSRRKGFVDVDGGVVLVNKKKDVMNNKHQVEDCGGFLMG